MTRAEECAIACLENSRGPVPATRLAKALGVSAPAARRLLLYLQDKRIARRLTGTSLFVLAGYQGAGVRASPPRRPPTIDRRVRWTDPPPPDPRPAPHVSPRPVRVVDGQAFEVVFSGGGGLTRF